MLDVEKVILKPNTLDKKKPTPIIPEKTERVVINFKKTQKRILRVSPHAPLHDLAPIICCKCEFDPLHTVLLKDYQAQEPLDLTKSLNDLGLRELYAMDISRESCQISHNPDIVKEKENKGIFSFFPTQQEKARANCQCSCDPTSEQASSIFHEVQHHFQTVHFQYPALGCTQEETCPTATDAHIPGCCSRPGETSVLCGEIHQCGRHR